MSPTEPFEMIKARDSFMKSENSQEYTYTEQMRYFEDGVDWLTVLDGSPFEPLAAKIKKRYTDKLIEDMSSPLPDIIKGLFDRQPAQWFRTEFHQEDIRNASALIRALDAAL
jgi:hypothetical protein